MIVNTNTCLHVMRIANDIHICLNKAWAENLTLKGTIAHVNAETLSRYTAHLRI